MPCPWLGIPFNKGVGSYDQLMAMEVNTCSLVGGQPFFKENAPAEFRWFVLTQQRRRVMFAWFCCNRPESEEADGGAWWWDIRMLAVLQTYHILVYADCPVKTTQGWYVWIALHCMCTGIRSTRVGVTRWIVQGQVVTAVLTDPDS